MLARKIHSFTPSLVIAASLSTLGLAACSSGFNGSNPAVAANSSASTCTSNCSQSSGAASGTSAWAALNASGSATGGQFAGIKMVQIDTVNKLLLVTLPVPANPYLNGIGVNVPLNAIPGADISLEPLASGGSQFVLSIPLQDVMKGIPSPVTQGLPNGNPLPGIVGGQLPSFPVQIPNVSNVTATVYVGASNVGIFVSTTFNPVVGLTFPITSADGSQTWGSISTVLPQGTSNGGFLLMIDIPSNIASIINANI